MTVTELTRTFVYETKDKGEKQIVNLPDPNPHYNTKQVLEHYSGEYPELSNAVITKGELGKDNVMTYKFKRTLDLKG